MRFEGSGTSPGSDVFGMIGRAFLLLDATKLDLSSRSWKERLSKSYPKCFNMIAHVCLRTISCSGASDHILSGLTLSVGIVEVLYQR